MVFFCNDNQEWKPRYGYKRANDATQDWLLEVPQNAGVKSMKFAEVRHSKIKSCQSLVFKTVISFQLIKWTEKLVVHQHSNIVLLMFFVCLFVFMFHFLWVFFSIITCHLPVAVCLKLF